MLKRPLIRLLLLLNLLALVVIGIRSYLGSRPVQDRGREVMALRAKRFERYGILTERDALRVRELSRAISARASVTDEELEELLAIPSRSPGGSPEAQDQANAEPFTALIRVKRFTPAQARRLVPVVRGMLSDPKENRISAIAGIGPGLKLRDPVCIQRIRKMSGDGLPDHKLVAKALLDRYEKKYGKLP